MVYSSTINRLNKSLRNKDLIQCMIEQNYVVKKDYVSKWFSVQEVSKEVLDSEMKVTFNNGNILKYETLCYIITGNGSTITSLETIEFKNKECIIIKKQIDGREREFKILTQEEYWGKPKIGVTTFNSYDGKTHHITVMKEQFLNQRSMITMENLKNEIHITIMIKNYFIRLFQNAKGNDI